MNSKNFLALHWASPLTGLLGAALLLGTGCTYANPNEHVAYREPAHVVVIQQDDYVYYPQYEVYYSNSRHQYGYRNGNTWDWRPTPPMVSVNVLYSSPAVRMEFHDSPEHHHNEVVRNYPRNWKQSDNHQDKHQDKDKKHDDQHDDNRQH